MFKKKFVWLVFLLALAFSTGLFAQEKFEKESRIRQKDVPPNALQFIDAAKPKSRIKWYSEEGLDRKSVEAKFTIGKSKHSVEFDGIGNVEDIEIEVNWEDLNPRLKESVTRYLEQHYSKHSVVKVQVQYTGSEPDLLSVLKGSKSNQSVTISYEVIVKCNQQNKVGLFEYLFDEVGNPISFSKIVFKNSSHLEY